MKAHVLSSEKRRTVPACDRLQYVIGFIKQNVRGWSAELRTGLACHCEFQFGERMGKVVSLQDDSELAGNL